MIDTTRRDFLARLAGGLPAAAFCPVLLSAAEPKPVETAMFAEGALRVFLRDNSQSPGILSGVDALFNIRESPDFDAYDPESRGSGAGLNFEHIISGHKNPNNSFTPRKGKFEMFVDPAARSATLVRKREDDPWGMSATMKYTVVAPHYIDVDFRCVPHDVSLFGKRGYAILFFADYMNDVEQVALNFRGIEGPDQPEKWIAADAPPGHPDWNQGGTYRSAPAADLEYDADHNFKLNSWSYDYPRFTQPFYYGRSGQGMTLILMFDRMYGEEDEIRFSLFKFKVPKNPRPAWDFQYVIRRLAEGKEYGFRMRLAWKRFVSAEDCLGEYETWRKAIS